MTWMEAVIEISVHRNTTLSDRKLRAWVKKLERWDPDHVYRTAMKLIDEWEMASDWPIGVLIKRLGRPLGEREQGEVFDGFCWSPVTGGAYGDWEKFDALPHEEREAIALHVLKWGTDSPQAELAERMCPGIVEKVRGVAA